MTALITRHFKIHNAIQFFESFSEAAATRYYFFIGKPNAYANTIPITGTVKTTSTSNTIVGQGTVFTAELAVGDRLGITGQSTVVRVHSIPSAQSIVVTPRPSATITTGANGYIRKLFSDLIPPAVDDSYQNVYYDIWRGIMSLKKFQTSDISHAIPRYQWTTNTRYDEYDDRDALLHDKQFYVVTNSSRVYKCIDNNRGAVSTVQPTTVDVSNIELTSDGYRWKYMYTITPGENLKFVTSSFMPVKTLTANDNSSQWYVQRSAAISGNGAINHIKVVANGSGYISTTNTFQYVVNSTNFQIKSNASSIDGSYVGSGIYISEGAGSGQLRKIVKYFGANNTLIVNTAFSTLPNTTSRYVISPLVTIRGDSGLSSTVRATAYVSNTFNGQVRRITVINQGRSYSQANAVVTSNSVYGRGAVLRPVMSPAGGHGSDPVDQLYGDAIMMNVKIQGSESGTFTTNNDFRVIGVLRDPLLANGSYANTSVIDQTVGVTVNGVLGDFTADEVVVGQTTGAKGRVVYFANSNAARSNGVLKLIRITTNGTGQGFAVGEILRGSTSTISGNVQSVSTAALKPYSGIVIYTENRPPVTRTPDQTEDYKLVIQY
jgi:hypothetical protein